MTSGGGEDNDTSPRGVRAGARENRAAAELMRDERTGAGDDGAEGVRRRERQRGREGGRVQVDGGGADGARRSVQPRGLRAGAGVAGPAGGGGEDEEAPQAVRRLPVGDCGGAQGRRQWGAAQGLAQHPDFAHGQPRRGGREAHGDGDQGLAFGNKSLSNP